MSGPADRPAVPEEEPRAGHPTGARSTGEGARRRDPELTTSYEGRSWLRTRTGAVSASIVALTGALLALVAYFSWPGSGPADYRPDLAGAVALEDPSGSPSACFRTVLHLEEPVTFAWVEVAATDSFQLYVNGERVGRDVFRSTWVTGMHDITWQLRKGANVLAVEVDRLSMPGPARVLLRAGVHGLRSPEPLEITTGPGWRSSPVPSAPGTRVPWTDPAFDGTLWESAQAVPSAQLSMPFRPLPVPPFAFREPPRGQWLRLAPETASAALLTAELTLPRRPDEAWMQLASSTGYELYLNGRPVAQAADDLERRTHLFPVDRFLRAGPNRVALRLRPQGQEAGVLADLMILELAPGPPGAHRRILARHSTGADWRLELPEGARRRREDLTLDLAGPAALSPFGRFAKLAATDEVRIPGPFFPAWWEIPAFLGGALVSLALWLLPTRLRAGGAGPVRRRLLVRDALFHLPTGVLAGALLLLSFDIRLLPREVLRPTVALTLGAVWLLLKVAALAARPPSRDPAPAPLPRRPRPRTRRRLVLAALAALTLVGGAYRLHDLDAISLDHDELSILSMAQGVARTGIPHRQLGSQVKILTTYELVPYPIALSSALLGWDEWGARLPAVLFGTATLFLLGWVGWRHLGAATGLLAASFYAFLPSAVRWSQNAFHLQQTQFFALLCIWAAWLALRRRPCPRGPVALAAAAFLATYLSWEGSGFLLPVLLLALVVRRRGDLSWLREKALWIAGGAVATVVVLQQGRRILHQVEYRALGTGLSDVRFPTLFFLDPRWDPRFYWDNFLWVENHSVLTLALLLGLPLLLRRPPARHFLLVLGGLLFCYTCLLPATSSRYVHFALPLLVLLAAAAVSRVLAVTGRLAGRLSSPPARGLAHVGRVGLLAVALLAPHPLVVRLYALSSSPDRPKPLTRMHVYRIDYRGAARYVAAHRGEKDLVLPNVPLALEHYTGFEGDYYLNTLATRRVLYDPDAEIPSYIDRFVGLPVIRGARDLREVLHRSERAWILVAPTSGFTLHNDPDVTALLESRARVAWEGYRAQVWLWDP